MADLFVSYSRGDRPRAQRLVNALTLAGFRVFWDQVTPPGVAWADFIERNLDEARALLVLWSRTSVESRWVRTEAYEALQQQKLLPILLDPVRQPLAFREIQAFDLTAWGEGNDESLKPLIEHLHQLVGEKPGPAIAAGPTGPGVESPPLPGWISGFIRAVDWKVTLGLSTFVALAIVVGVFWWPRVPAEKSAGPVLSTSEPPAVLTTSASNAGSASMAAVAASALPHDVTPGAAAIHTPPTAAGTKNNKPLDPRCRDIMERTQLGQLATPDEQAFLQGNCP